MPLGGAAGSVSPSVATHRPAPQAGSLVWSRSFLGVKGTEGSERINVGHQDGAWPLVEPPLKARLLPVSRGAVAKSSALDSA